MKKNKKPNRNFIAGALAFDKLMEKIGYDNAVAALCATATVSQFIHVVGADA